MSDRIAGSIPEVEALRGASDDTYLEIRSHALGLKHRPKQNVLPRMSLNEVEELGAGFDTRLEAGAPGLPRDGMPTLNEPLLYHRSLEDLPAT